MPSAECLTSVSQRLNGRKRMPPPANLPGLNDSEPLVVETSRLRSAQPVCVPRSSASRQQTFSGSSVEKKWAGAALRSRRERFLQPECPGKGSKNSGLAQLASWQTQLALPTDHRNPHEPAPVRGSTQKKTNPMRGWSSCLVGPQGLEPWTKGLCLPLRLSPPLSSLWSGLYLPVTGWPSSLYTFPRVFWGLGSVLASPLGPSVHRI